MALPPIRYVDGTDWVLTTAGIKPYPKAANQLMELAESRGWWTMNGLPVRLAPDGSVHRIRVEVGRGPFAGRNGYRVMVLWTSEPGPHSQFHVEKCFIMSTEWDGWKATGVADVMAKIDRHPVTAALVLRDDPGTGADHY